MKHHIDEIPIPNSIDTFFEPTPAFIKMREEMEGIAKGDIDHIEQMNDIFDAIEILT